MRRRLRRFFELNNRERFWFVQAWGWLIVFWLGVRLRPFSRSRSLAASPGAHRQTRPAAEPSAAEIERIRYCVDAARAAHLLPMRCLERSLTLQRLLRRQGHPAQLAIGAGKNDGVLSAHAWVEIDGTPIGEPEAIDERFQRLVSV